MDTSNHMECPECGSPTVSDAVDIGVGTMHGPDRCPDCGWSRASEIKYLMEEFGTE